MPLNDAEMFCVFKVHSLSRPEVVKDIPDQGIDCCVSNISYFCFSLVFMIYVVLCFLVLGC